MTARPFIQIASSPSRTTSGASRVPATRARGILAGLLLVAGSPAGLCSQAPTVGAVIGRVAEAGGARAVAGAIVELVGAGRDARTGPDGRFDLERVPPGVYSLRVRALGYRPVLLSDVVVGSGKPLDLTIALAPLPVELADIEVQASYFRSPLEGGADATELTAEEVRRTPGGQEDVVRTVSVLPGVGVTTAGRNDLIVRGGAPFENLFLIDGIPVPNVNHFGSQGSSGGPLSLINNDLVSDVRFSAGGFRARYGNRTASLTRIGLREGSRRAGGELNLSATGFGVLAEGPLGAGTTAIASVRRSYLDLLFKAAGFSFVPAYWDFQVKTVTRPDATNTISFLGIGAINTVDFVNDDPDDRLDNSRILSPEQHQYIAGVTWQRLLDRALLRVTLGRTWVRFRTVQRDSLDPPQDVFRNFSTEGENTLGVDLTVQASRHLEVTAGAVGRVASRLRYDVAVSGDWRRDAAGTPQPLVADTTFRAWQAEAYADAAWRATPRVRLTAGARASYYDFAGQALRVAPRFEVAVAATPATTLTARLGRYYQAPSYVWLIGSPQNAALEPLMADQAVLGIQTEPRADLQVQVEGFYKRYRDYPARVFRPQAVLAPAGFEDVTTDIPFGLEPLTADGRGHAYGAELLVLKRLSTMPLYGLLSASVARTAFTGLDGVSRPGAFDTRVIGNAVLRYRASPAWELSGRFRVATGRPYTPFVTSGPGAGTLDFTRYHTARLPAFHALDVRVDRRWSFRGLQLEVYLDVQNVYGRTNTSQYYWNARTSVVEPNESLGVLPSLGVNIEF